MYHYFLILLFAVRLPSPISTSIQSGQYVTCFYSNMTTEPVTVLLNTGKDDAPSQVLIHYGMSPLSKHEVNKSTLEAELNQEALTELAFTLDTYSKKNATVSVPPNSITAVFQISIVCGFFDGKGYINEGVRVYAEKVVLDVYSLAVGCHDRTEPLDVIMGYEKSKWNNQGTNSFTIAVPYYESVNFTEYGQSVVDFIPDEAKDGIQDWLNTQLRKLSPSNFTGMDWTAHPVSMGLKKQLLNLTIEPQSQGQAQQAFAKCGPLLVTSWTFPVYYSLSDQAQHTCQSPEFNPCVTIYGMVVQPEYLFSNAECQDCWAFMSITQDAKTDQFNYGLLQRNPLQESVDRLADEDESEVPVMEVEALGELGKQFLLEKLKKTGTIQFNETRGTGTGFNWTLADSTDMSDFNDNIMTLEIPAPVPSAVYVLTCQLMGWCLGFEVFRPIFAFVHIDDKGECVSVAGAETRCNILTPCIDDFLASLEMTDTIEPTDTYEMYDII